MIVDMKVMGRTSKSQFKKGVSGNPAGRPIGSRNKATLACEQMLEGESEELLRVAGRDFSEYQKSILMKLSRLV